MNKQPTTWDDIAKEILVRMRALLASASRWTRAAEARGDDLIPVGPMQPTATCFCLTGALFRAFAEVMAEHSWSWGQWDGALQAAARALVNVIKNDDFYSYHLTRSELLSVIIIWNDMSSRLHTEVVELIEQALANLNTNPNAQLAARQPFTMALVRLSVN